MIIGLVVGLILFFSTIISFSIGFKFGLSSARGIQPKLEPIKSVKDAIGQPKPQDNSFTDALNRMLSYNGQN